MKYAIEIKKTIDGEVIASGGVWYGRILKPTEWRNRYEYLSTCKGDAYNSELLRKIADEIDRRNREVGHE